LPSTIEYIGLSAFANCDSLKVIDSAIEVIDNIEIRESPSDNKVSAFKNIPVDCIWRVPAGTAPKYKAQPWWVSTWRVIDSADLNNDGKVDIADAVNILNIMAEGTFTKESDINDDGKIDIADFVSILNFMAE